MKTMEDLSSAELAVLLAAKQKAEAEAAKQVAEEAAKHAAAGLGLLPGVRLPAARLEASPRTCQVLVSEGVG